MTVDTRAVTNRRTLRLASLDALLAEADRLAHAERSGSLTLLGNWSLGQMFGHLAAWTSFPYDGYPAGFKPPPAPVRVLFRLMRRKFIHGTLPVGMKIPHVEGGTYGTEPRSTDDGLSRLRNALTRLKSAAPQSPNPAFGPLTHQEWIELNLRHAELHLSFAVPG